MRPKQVSLFFGFILLTLSIVNAQSKSKNTIPRKTKAGVEVSGFLQSGNVQTFIFRSKGELVVNLSKKLTFETTNSYIYQEFGKVKADEDILSLNFLHYNKEKRWHPFVLSFISTNFRREIDLRHLVGAGITYNMIQKRNHELKFSVSSEYEFTRFSNTDFNLNVYDGMSEMETLRATTWIKGSHKLFNNRLVFSHESFVQPSLQQSNNFRWQTELGLELPLWKFLNFKINCRYTYENIVIVNQQEDDCILTLGFSIKNYETGK